MRRWCHSSAFPARRENMNWRVSARVVLGVACIAVSGGVAASGAEIKLLCAVALHPAIDVLVPVFEKSSGHKVSVAYGNAGAIADRFQKGEAADLMINAAPLMDQLRAQGKVVAGDRIIIAKVGVGAFAQGCPEARHQFRRRLQTLDVGRKI